MMKKLISGLVLLAMLACLVLPAAAAEPTALPMTVAEAVDGVSAYCTAAMQAAGTYSDWSILQLARSGNLTDAMRQDYLAGLDSFISMTISLLWRKSSVPAAACWTNPITRSIPARSSP